MGSFFFTSASGWIASILLSLEILLPYLLRPTRLSGPLDLPRSYAKPYLRRLWPHYWAGYLLLALSVTHAWIPMQASGYLKRANIFGLWFATAALSLLLLQVTLGLRSAGFAAANPRAHSRLALLDNARSDFFRSHPHLAQLLNCSFASNSAASMN